MTGYPNVLKYYMWAYQVYFLISCQVDTDDLFSKIDERLQPTVFMIGFSRDKDSKVPICYEPESMEHISEVMPRLQEVARTLEANDPDRDMFYTGEGQNEKMRRQRRATAFRNALQRGGKDQYAVESIFEYRRDQQG